VESTSLRALVDEKDIIGLKVHIVSIREPIPTAVLISTTTSAAGLTVH
jgi:hypothetical protein